VGPHSPFAVVIPLWPALGRWAPRNKTTVLSETAPYEVDIGPREFDVLRTMQSPPRLLLGSFYLISNVFYFRRHGFDGIGVCLRVLRQF
jgi:hypothetical protein